MFEFELGDFFKIEVEWFIVEVVDEDIDKVLENICE